MSQIKVYVDHQNINLDLSNHATKNEHKGSHLHQLQPAADPNGNRAERREFRRKQRKKGK